MQKHSPRKGKRMAKRYYWIKLKDTFLTSDTVDYFMSQPNGANYVVIYQMLCLKTINTGGRLERQIGEIIIPYDENKIQRDLKYFTLDTIKVAMNLYRAFGLIYEDKDGVLVLSDYENLVGSETEKAEAMRRLRDRRENEALESGNNSVTMLPESGNNSVTMLPECYIEKEIRDKEKDIRDTDTKEDSAASRLTVPVQEIFDAYNEICVSLPHAETITQMRRKAIHARYIEVKDVEKFKAVFRKAQESAFLTGRNDRGWRADLDWILKPANFTKIAEGNYDNRGTKAAVSSESFDTDAFVAKAYERGVR